MIKGYGEDDFHKLRARNRMYYPVYLEKMAFVRKFLQANAVGKKAVDIGCGEGLLVEEFRKKGFDITGVDKTHCSESVERGNITGLRFEDSAYDIVLCLDVVEHLPFWKQRKAFGEIRRILKPGGVALVTLPNLAHLASRVSLLLTGKFIRASTIERHVGGRPISEFLKLIEDAGLVVVKRKGFFPTLPVISLFTYLFPSRVFPLHWVENRLFAYPNWCIFNILLLKRRGVSK